MNTTTKNKPQRIRKEDFVAYDVRNIRTGEVYQTCEAFDKRTIDGVSFTQVVKNGKILLVRSDMLK